MQAAKSTPGARLDWIGCIAALAGAGLLAANIERSPYGWWLFLLSNVAWIAFGLRTRTWSLVVMQIGFTGTSMLGIWRWLT